MKQETLRKLAILPRQPWFLIVILAVGIFLRVYDFHRLLDFGSDQANDATRVSAVVNGEAPWPSYGPNMSKSGKSSNNRESRFRLGPLYTDFQIISAKLFGNLPESLAYPDALFSVLTLPLLYYFWRRYFSTNTSVVLTGLYAVSFYSLTFSHAAWNPNSLPFFSLLLVLSLGEFLAKREAVGWWWAVALGVALGVGTQLHAIALVLFPVTTLVIFVVSIRQHRALWPKWTLAAVLLIVLNLGQIMAEYQNNFKNTQTFFLSMSSSKSNNASDSSWSLTFFKNVSCHIEANTYILSSIGDSNCDFWLPQYFQGDTPTKTKALIRNPTFLFGWILSVAFSVLGYSTLLHQWKREQDPSRKSFLGVILVFVGLSFLVLFPVLAPAFRYFVHVFFVPLLFVGFCLEYASCRLPRQYLLIPGVLVIGLILSNLFSLQQAVKDGGVRGRLVLSQVEAIRDTMREFAGQGSWDTMVTKNVDDTYRSLKYLANQSHYSIEKIGTRHDAPPSMPVIFMGPALAPGDSGMSVDGNPVEAFRTIGGVTVYKLK